MRKYDIPTVLAAAAGQWPQIFAALCNVSAEVFDGRHRACPKCGGHDRFRAIDQRAGAVLCNQCFNAGNGDGIATVQWLLGCRFPDALAKVAEHLRIDHDRALSRRRSGTLDPARHLEFLPWQDRRVQLWCDTKPPITPQAVQAIGGQLACYRGEWIVVAIPVVGAKGNQVGWVLYEARGRKLPHKDKAGNLIQMVPVKVASGSRNGVIGSLDGSTVWKCEGPPDLMALIAAGLPDGHTAFTTPFGATDPPPAWIADRLRSKTVRVVHDCDQPGQQGATWVQKSNGERRQGWCPSLADKATDVRNVVLPYQIEETDGKDLRDWLQAGGTMQGLLDLADQAAPVPAEVSQEGVPADLPAEADDDPHRLARLNLEQYRQQGRELRFWRGEWYQYLGNRYRRIDRGELDAKLNGSVKQILNDLWQARAAEDPENAGTVRKVTGRLIADVRKATESMALLKSRQEMPSWLDGRPPSCLAVKNGILDLGELFKPKEQRSDAKVLIPHSSQWFATNVLSFDFEPTAKCERWVAFLEDVFNGDAESIEALQKWFGYLLLPETFLQKMLFVIGPKRSGKGTIMRIMERLYGGQQGIATPRLGELANPYALNGYQGKTVAVISDARLSARADETTITERLLSITGEDPQNIERKYLDTLHGVRMPLRFTLFSNLLPELSDSSAAFLSRCIFLSMPNSYEGREDLHLADRLLEEMPGILNWAIAGRYYLQRDGRIDQPGKGLQLHSRMRHLLSPVAAFIESRCQVGGQVEPKVAFDAWNEWAAENGTNAKMGIQAFSKKIHDVMPGIETKKIRCGSKTFRIWEGISLLPSDGDEEKNF